MLADRAKIPFSVKGLRASIPFPHAKPDSLVSGPPGCVQARTHQLFADAASKPFAQHIQTDQLDRVCAFDALLRFTVMEPRVTCRAPVNFRDQEVGSGSFQLTRQARDVE